MLVRTEEMKSLSGWSFGHLVVDLSPLDLQHLESDESSARTTETPKVLHITVILTKPYKNDKIKVNKKIIELTSMGAVRCIIWRPPNWLFFFRPVWAIIKITCGCDSNPIHYAVDIHPSPI